MTHAQNQRSLRQPDLRGVVVEREKSDSGLCAQANRRRADVNFGARILVRPQIVAGNHGTVGNGRDPVVFAGRPK